jgi:phenylalanyl-tRNA synthetase alpha chain
MIDIQQYIDEINSYEIKDNTSLEEFRIAFLGTKNKLKDLFKIMGQLSPDEKKEFGQKMNYLKTLAEEKFAQYKAELDSSHLVNSTSPQDDLSKPAFPFNKGTRHPVSIVLNNIIDIFTRIGFTVEEDREIEDEWHNFTALNTPDDHPARDMTDTYYLLSHPGRLLRSQTSTVQVRVMERQKPPIRIISPGRVYRNETISARSHCQFHQVEGLFIDKGVSLADMKLTLNYFAREMFGPDTRTRLRASYFPFTEPSAELDVYWGLENETDYRITKGTGWLEILGCGMVDPAVLQNLGIDPNVYSGFAFGMGIERQAMLKYKIPDIRYLFENDLRFLSQF